MNPPIREAALSALDATCSVIPVKSDGTKACPFSWGKFRTTRATRDQIELWFGSGQYTGLAVIGGTISGNLEVLDFDDANTYQTFLDTGEAIGHGELLGRIRSGYEERTPDGGAHLLYRCEAIGGNAKLAMRPGPDPAKPKRDALVTIETRGEGGYAIVAPSNGSVHPSGRAWSLVSGGFDTVATITPDERAQLHALARSFDEMPIEEAPAPRGQAATKDGVRPGDAFRQQHGTLDDFRRIVEPHEWKLIHRRGDVGYFRRPGKDDGWSATFGHAGTDLFYPFTSSTVFQAERGYNPFSVYATLYHAGDFTAAARELGKQGYGEKRNTLGIDPSTEPQPAPLDPNDGTPKVNAQNQNIPEVSAQAWAALQKANNPVRLVRFGDVLSRIEVDDDGVPKPKEITETMLAHELARSATWWRVAKDPQTGVTEPKHAKVPLAVVQDMLAAATYPLPSLTSIVRIPTFARDGSLHAAPGYDHQTRSFYAPQQGVTVPPVPAKPTEDQLEQAKTLIFDELLGDFPFAGDAERANAICLLLEPAARNFIDGPTPLRLIEAPTAGSGKGLLVDALLGPAIAKSVAVMPAATNDEEWGKKILSVLLRLPAAVLIDNVTKPIDSGVLAAVLTSTTYGDRQLGGNKIIDLPVRCIWLMTANNPTMSTEIARRTVRIRIDPKVDRPWERTGFRHDDLRGWAKANRGRLIWAALVIVRHWLNDGAPHGTKRLGSYESWSSVMGGILGSAGIEGFLQNLSEFYEIADLEGAIWRQFVSAWAEQFGEAETGVSELFSIAESVEGFDFGKGQEKSQRTVFGMALGRQRDRVIGDYRLVQTRTVQRVKRWRLIRTREAGNVFAAMFDPPAAAAAPKTDEEELDQWMH